MAQVTATPTDLPERSGSGRVAVIGAGSSGIAACQVLDARGLDFECFEIGSEVGGNWRYGNDNGLSSAYKSLHINTSRRMMAYATYPMPEDYPDYPGHAQIANYFDDYVDHFGFRDRIRFRTEVLNIERQDGSWRLEWKDLESGVEGVDNFEAVIVANGHHWNPRWPEPAFEGQSDYTGVELHVHDYKEPDVLKDKNVLVLGIGNSATDLAVESSRNADRTFLAMRRGAWIVPKYIGSQPIDEIAPGFISRLPFPVQRFLLGRTVKRATGDPTDYGLPKPDHKLTEAHPTVSSDLLARLGHGDIQVKPNIAAFEGGTKIRFDDGSVEDVDVVIYCTGYKITFPFLKPELLDAPDNRIPLYQRVVHPDLEGLYFVGLIQPLGAVMPLAEAQSEWIADLLEGKCALPDNQKMHAEIQREAERMAKRYVASKRHTIQVDFAPYMRMLSRERKTGRGSGASNSRKLSSPIAS